MPIYEYRCGGCGHDFDKLQRMNADAPPCPACGHADTERRISLSSFHLKGSGWYKTDYAGASASGGSGGSAGGETGGDAKSDGAGGSDAAAASTPASTDSSSSADG